MGSDDIHHKKRGRVKESFKRRKPIRDAYELVLIVCEGTKTEPNYLCDIRNDFRLNGANIRVGSGTGSDPISVVNTAIKLFEESREYDFVFCVFDKDRHQNYQAALNKITSTTLRKGEGRKNRGTAKFKSIVSVPCFEYWLLLHFKMTDSPYASTGNRSICEQVICELREYIPNYGKGDDGIYLRTKDRITDAILRSKQVLQNHADTGSDNPSTYVHELVEKLLELKK